MCERERVLPGANYRKKFSSFKTRALASGVYPYFEQNLSLINEKDSFKNEFKRLVTDLCSNVRSKLKPSIELYDWFVYKDETNFVDGDIYTRNWLENIEICRVVEAKQYTIASHLHRMFFFKSTSGGESIISYQLNKNKIINFNLVCNSLKTLLMKYLHDICSILRWNSKAIAIKSIKTRSKMTGARLLRFGGSDEFPQGNNWCHLESLLLSVIVRRTSYIVHRLLVVQ